MSCCIKFCTDFFLLVKYCLELVKFVFRRLFFLFLQIVNRVGYCFIALLFSILD